MKRMSLLLVLSMLSGCYDSKVLGEGTGGAGSPSTTTGLTATEGAESAQTVELKMMARWNGIVQTHPSSFDAQWPFDWTRWNQFPHPTYKGGSLEAYQRFAQLLLAYLGESDIFVYLQQHQGFYIRLLYVFDSGSVGMDTSLRELVSFFAEKGQNFGIDAESLARFADYAAQIAATDPA